MADSTIKIRRGNDVPVTWRFKNPDRTVFDLSGSDFVLEVKYQETLLTVDSSSNAALGVNTAAGTVSWTPTVTDTLRFKEGRPSSYELNLVSETETRTLVSGAFVGLGFAAAAEEEEPEEEEEEAGAAAQTVRLVMSDSQVELLASDAGNVVFIFGTAGGIINLAAPQSAAVNVGGTIEVVYYNPSFIGAAITVPGAAAFFNGGIDQSVRAGTTVKLRKVSDAATALGQEVWAMHGGDIPVPEVTTADAGKVLEIVDIGAAVVAWQVDG